MATMNPERWRKIEQLYQSALDQQPGRRVAFLTAACEGDQDLQRKVESLLAGSDATDASADRSAREAVAGQPETRTDLTPGTRLGPYQILGPLGEGGMGKVYRGLDTRLNRAVAIKISAEPFSQRFEREAQAISMLNHPHICTLYDVGPNCLVTELVDGETLRDWIKREPTLGR